MSDRRKLQERNKSNQFDDGYDIFDPPSLDPDSGDGMVVRGFGQECAEDAPTVMAWSSGNLRAEAAWMLGSETPAPSRDRAPTPNGILVQKRAGTQERAVDKRSRWTPVGAQPATEPVAPPPIPMWLVAGSVLVLTALATSTFWYLLS